jgi:hypothetical protein
MFDVRVGTGIPEQRLSAAETGRRALTAPEEALLKTFLTSRLAMVAQSEGWTREGIAVAAINA